MDRMDRTPRMSLADLNVDLDSILDVDDAAKVALNTVAKRRSNIFSSALVGFGGSESSHHKRISEGSIGGDSSDHDKKRISGGSSSPATRLSAAARRASLLGRTTSVRWVNDLVDLEAVAEGDDDDDDSDDDDEFKRKDDDDDNDDENDDGIIRPSVLTLPDFEIAKALLQNTDFDPALASGSVDLGSKRYFAKMKDFAPASFDVMSETKVLLGVSLGSKNTELACLDAMLQYICANFEECTILPGDYIYRLTLQLKYGLDDQSAIAEAVRAQQEYKAMCTTVLAQYTGMCKFHWRPMSEIVEKYPEEYKDSYAIMKQLYQQDKPFRDSVKSFSEVYIARIDKESAAEAAVVSIRYLLEECAILNCMALESPTTMVYAGSIQSIKDICAGKFQDIPCAMKTNLRFVEVSVSPRGKFFPKGERKVLKIGELTVGSMDRPTFSTSINLDEETLKKLIKVSREARPKVGTLLVTAGKPCSELVLIRKGRAEELLKREDGSLQRLAVLEQGSIVGADAFFGGSNNGKAATSPVTVNTLEACECSKISRKAFNQLVEKDPSLAITLLTEVSRLQSARAALLMYELQNMRI